MFYIHIMNAIDNRKARFNYEIIEKYTAGIVLQGSEVKSIKAGKCNISDAYCYVNLNCNEVWIKGAHIAKHKSDAYTNHDEYRERKLLLNKKEIRKIAAQALNPGITVVPLKLYSTKTGLLKLEVGVCRGKKLYDKRESIKERDNERELDRIKKSF